MSFWIIAILMVAAGLILILPALLGKKNSSSSDNREQNIRIAQERMAELKNELESGSLSQDTYQQTLEELEKSLLIDVTEAGREVNKLSNAPAKKSIIALVLFVPLLSFGLYKQLGSPQYMDVAGPGSHPINTATATATPPQAAELPSMEEMISGLKKKTKDNPDDPDAWYLLGRLYAATEKFDESVKAYEKLVVVSDRQPTALVVLADSVAMTQGGNLSGRPLSLVMEALEKEPTHTTALWMAGQAAADQKDYLQAIDYWQGAAKGLKDNEEMLGELQSMISEAVGLAKEAGMDVKESTQTTPPVAVLSDSSIEIEVTIDPALLKEIKEDDVLFIFARAVSGPPMPLAAIKRQARELPVSLVLDDSSMLRPGTSLAQFEQLKLGARVSHSGQPIAQTGDLQSEVQVIRTGAGESILLHINQRLP